MNIWLCSLSSNNKQHGSHVIYNMLAFTHTYAFMDLTITRSVFRLPDVKLDKSINTAGYLLWAKQSEEIGTEC